MQEAGLHRPSFKAVSKLNDGQTALGLTCALWVRQQASKAVVQEPTRGQMESKAVNVRRRCSGVFDAAQLDFTWTQAIDGTKQH